jgi:spore coat protein U-like protein
VSFGQAPTARSFASIAQSISVLCTKDLAVYTVGLDSGQNASSGRRRMAGGGQFLQYDIFKPGGALWGASGGNRSANSSPANGVNAQSFPYNVQVYSDQATPAVGVYTDLVVVDVTF